MLDKIDIILSVVDILLCLLDIGLIVYLFFYRFPKNKRRKDSNQGYLERRNDDNQGY
jgi:hypothetical protein